MKVCIFGSNGMLGTYVSSLLSQNNINVISLTRKEYDLSKIKIHTIKKLFIDLNLQKDDVIINCAGIIPQSSKQHEINNRLYFKINSIFPVILSMICNQLGCKMIHVTTDCVFTGKKGSYNEDDLHDEINDYGTSKSLGELCDATIIRTSIIGEELRNKRSLLEWVKSNAHGEINGYDNHYWNGVTCLQLSFFIKDIIENNKFWKGVKHIYSPRSVSKYELVSMINKIYELDINIKKYNTENNIDKTITSKYEKIFNIPDLYVQIQEMKNFKLK